MVTIHPWATVRWPVTLGQFSPSGGRVREDKVGTLCVAFRSASALAHSTSSQALASASSRAHLSASSLCCFSSLLTCLRQRCSFALVSRTSESSSLPDCNSSVGALVQSLGSTMEGTVGVVDLAVADILKSMAGNWG